MSCYSLNHDANIKQKIGNIIIDITDFIINFPFIDQFAYFANVAKFTFSSLISQSGEISLAVLV